MATAMTIDALERRHDVAENASQEWAYQHQPTDHCEHHEKDDQRIFHEVLAAVATATP